MFLKKRTPQIIPKLPSAYKTHQSLDSLKSFFVEIFFIISVILYTSLSFATTGISGVSQPRLFKVVLDPGHGGSDEGTVFENGSVHVAEKTVTLQLAQEVSHQLRARGFLVSLTRKSDEEVPLPERTKLANRLGADAFISIHTNSIKYTTSRDAEGVETYILNNATDASSRRLARLENSVVSSEPGASPEDMDVALILKDLRLDANLSESKRLACGIQSKLVEATAGNSYYDGEGRLDRSLRRNRGVKQALFHVLLGADMPSILVEAGFLSHPHDRSLLLSPTGRQTIGRAIANAVEEYRQKKLQKNYSVSLSRCKIN